MKQFFRASAAVAGAIVMGLTVAACGSSPSSPSPPPSGGGGVTPPANNAPSIQSIVVQGTRAKQPAGFADVGEAVQITATVKDDETPVSQLQYNWTAPVGTFSGSGATVTWQAPAQAATPVQVDIKLEVIERYGTAPSTSEHRVTSTTAVALHDSIKEVGDMARQFLLDFSDSSIRNVDFILRNFGNASTCPDVREIDSERADVAKDRDQFQIINSRIGSAKVTVNFGGRCPFRSKTGDACAVVPSYWQSRKLSTGEVGAVDGDDIVAASFSSAGNRWWLCASDYDGRLVSGVALKGFRALR